MEILNLNVTNILNFETLLQNIFMLRRSKVILFILLICGGKVFGQAGIIDSSFGTNGVVAAFPQGGAGNIVIQPDGKLLLVGVLTTVMIIL
ncbi:MAG: hypothetical protein LH473_13050 [Chitinophagales bacterium]|nr:hypothetical protein [Chitinophagales bacterium]